jgi:alkylation response protein AidB-like acyl-CoA dehydrogenase
MSDPRDALDDVIDAVVTPNARAVDEQGGFPRQAIEALGQAGTLGLVSATEVGGGGQGMADAATVIERLAGVCGSTAMVMVMHYAATSLIEAHGPRGCARPSPPGTT